MDSLLHGEVKYTSKVGSLLAVRNYSFRKLDGRSIEYYQNGKRMRETTFNDNVKNGVNRYFDEGEQCFYQDYYYYGLPVGPIVYFDTASHPKIFYFATLENKNVVAIDYNNWIGVESIYESCISFTKNSVKVDSTVYLDVFLYLITAPKFSFKYTIVKRDADQSHNDFVDVVSISDTLPFTNIRLSMGNADSVYAVKASIFDSIKMKQTVIYKDL